MINGIYAAPDGGPGPIGALKPPASVAPPVVSVPAVSAPSAPVHSASGNKATPISMLQELCQKLNKQPRYDLLTMEGRAHQPSFVFRCTVGDVTGEGHGTSKKAGKHQAAENVLNQLKAGIVPGDEQPEVLQPEVDNQVSLNYGGEINPVGTLQELVVSRGWRLPDYSLASEAGPAHKKEFIICCSVEKLKEYGSGSSKKSAKRNAASAMLVKLKEIPVDSKEHIVDNDDLDTTFTGRGARGFLPIEMLRNQSGERILLDKTQSDQTTQCPDPLQALNEHANQHCFKVDYLDIDVRSTCGLFQCLLRLQTLPVSVVHGQGATVRDSHVEAARNALQYLSIVASEKSAPVPPTQ